MKGVNPLLRHSFIQVTVFKVEEKMKLISKIIFDSIESTGFRWCILRKENEIIDGVENDIDIFVEKNNFNRILNKIASDFKLKNISIIRQRIQPAGISMALFYPPSGEFQKLDIVYDTTFTFISIFPPNLIAENVVEGQSFPVLDEEIGVEIVARKNLVRQNLLGYMKREWNARFQYPQPIFKRFLIIGYLKAFWKNIRKPSGYFITLVGPDGSGKTTIADNLLGVAKSQFFSCGLYHFNIGIFPRLSAFNFRNKSQPDYTLPGSGTNAPIQKSYRAFIYSIYYGLELLIYSHFKISRKKRLGEFILFDRFFHDYLFQRSYRKAPRIIIKNILRVSRRPDLVVYCSGDSSLINKRKPELSSEEISLQQFMIEKDLLPFWNSVGVKVLTLDTTSASIEEVTVEIAHYLSKVSK